MQTEHTFTRTHAHTSRTLAHKGRTVGSAGGANSGKEIVGLASGALHFTHIQALVIVCTQKHATSAHRTARMRTRSWAGSRSKRPGPAKSGDEPEVRLDTDREACEHKGHFQPDISAHYKRGMNPASYEVDRTPCGV